MPIAAGQWWHTPLIPALGWERMDDLCEFKANLVYRMSSRTGSIVIEKLCRKTKKMQIAKRDFTKLYLLLLCNSILDKCMQNSLSADGEEGRRLPLIPWAWCLRPLSAEIWVLQIKHRLSWRVFSALNCWKNLQSNGRVIKANINYQPP